MAIDKDTQDKDTKTVRGGMLMTLGASNHTDEERQTEDYYATDPIAIDVLLNDGGVTLDNNVWECACGGGHLAERLKEYGYNVRASDIVNRGYGEEQIDFLKYNKEWNGDIVTNPPYKYAKEFIEHALEIIPNGKKVFIFLRVQFLEGTSRRELFRKYPPKCVYVSSRRILTAKNAEFEKMRRAGGTTLAQAWYEFEKGYKGETILKWINPK